MDPTRTAIVLDLTTLSEVAHAATQPATTDVREPAVDTPKMIRSYNPSRNSTSSSGLSIKTMPPAMPITAMAKCRDMNVLATDRQAIDPRHGEQPFPPHGQQPGGEAGGCPLIYKHGGGSERCSSVNSQQNQRRRINGGIINCD